MGSVMGPGMGKVSQGKAAWTRVSTAGSPENINSVFSPMRRPTAARQLPRDAHANPIMVSYFLPWSVARRIAPLIKLNQLEHRGDRFAAEAKVGDALGQKRAARVAPTALH